ncbi:UNVERIFIED_CONTAM: hypothetical protein Sradi_2635000 [Sesamum radiatum]|uniref:Uncharacterized protein n=1 Tax=Sesamum radiatum TaxID=300843 RepID=A0AAW2S678_SESRA
MPCCSSEGAPAVDDIRCLGGNSPSAPGVRATEEGHPTELARGFPSLLRPEMQGQGIPFDLLL